MAKDPARLPYNLPATLAQAVNEFLKRTRPQRHKLPLSPNSHG